jgi:hypothetical protein
MLPGGLLFGVASFKSVLLTGNAEVKNNNRE